MAAIQNQHAHYKRHIECDILLDHRNNPKNETSPLTVARYLRCTRSYYTHCLYFKLLNCDLGSEGYFKELLINGYCYKTNVIIKK